MATDEGINYGAVLSQKIDLVISMLSSQKVPNLTQAEFARRSGLSRATVCRYVNSGKLKSSRGRVLSSELSKYQG